MSFTRKLMQVYFNYAYNPVYDFTTGRLDLYRKLQERCVGKLTFEDNDKVLCLGLGTGNEVFYILEMNRNLGIVGVDYSHTALRKAHKKALGLGKEIELLLMDVRSLEFAAGSFDKVLCLHVMDFVEENDKVTEEILRVLKDGGQFVITYPSGKEGMSLGLNILKDIIRRNHNSRKHRTIAYSKSLVEMLAGIVYLPLFLRPKKRSYMRHELKEMFLKFGPRDLHVKEYPMYQDFIVYGRK